MKQIEIKHEFCIADIVPVTVNGECTHADTRTQQTIDWDGNDSYYTKCAYCGAVYDEEFNLFYEA